MRNSIQEQPTEILQQSVRRNLFFFFFNIHTRILLHKHEPTQMVRLSSFNSYLAQSTLLTSQPGAHIPGS